jgi:hypothetical protein
MLLKWLLIVNILVTSGVFALCLWTHDRAALGWLSAALARTAAHSILLKSAR